jgi:hypothetical protein
MIDTDKYSGMIGDTEVRMHSLNDALWAIDIIKHTSDDTTELVDGWVVESEQEAHDLYHKRVNELLKWVVKEMIE